MRKILAILLLTASAWATQAVSGTIQSVGSTATNSGAFVRFELKNCGGNIPRVTGTTIVAPVSKDFLPDSNGTFSGVIWGNNEITCGTAQNTYYQVSLWVAGRTQSSNSYDIRASFNLNSATPISSITPQNLSQGVIVGLPAGSQTISQPNGSTFAVNNLAPILSPTTFSNLGTPINGALAYCSDCVVADPCAGGGTGAIAKRVNSTWSCGVGGAAVFNHTMLSTTHTDAEVGSVVLGDVIYGDNVPKWQRLAGNTTSTRQFLSQTGTGSVSAAPAWAQPSFSDITGVATTGQLPPSTVYNPMNAVGDLIIGGSSGTPSRLGIGLNGQCLTSNGTTDTWASCGVGSAHNFLSATHSDTVAAAPVLGDIITANATPAWTKVAGNTTTTKKYLSQTGTGTISAAPAWSQPAFSELSGTVSDAQEGAHAALTNVANVFTAIQTFPASTTGAASFNMVNGATPTSPNIGDFWMTSGGTIQYRSPAGTTRNIEYQSLRNVANGYAGLDASARIAAAQAPLSLTSVGVLRTLCTGATTNATDTLNGFGTTTGACTGTATNRFFRTPSAGTVQNLYVTADAGLNASSGTVTIYQCTAANQPACTTLTSTGVTCIVGTGNQCSDTTHTFAVAAGDGIIVKFTGGGASETFGNAVVSFEIR